MLGLLIRQRRLSIEEFAEQLEVFARTNSEVGTLSVRHVHRLVAGQLAPNQLRPATIRLLEQFLERPVEELLAPPHASSESQDLPSPELPEQVDVEAVRRSQENWLRVRNAHDVRGHRLALQLYSKTQRAPGGYVLAGPGWLLDEPVDLDSVRLKWAETQPSTPRLGALDHVLPLTDRGGRYTSYSRAVRDLVRPRLLENRLSYRLLDVGGDGLELTFGTTTFFDMFDLKESLAHEFKAAWLASGGALPDYAALPLRAAIGDPFDPRRVLMSPGISTLTIRRDRWGEHRFMLHERDGTAVADGGSLCAVMPAGEFQPSSVAPADVHNDFSLWRNIMREFSEEFLGNPEHDGAGSHTIGYAAEEPFRSFERARAEGRFRLWYYGLVADPFALRTGFSTVAVIDDEVFDRLFADLVAVNDEGKVLAVGGGVGVPFTAEAIDRIAQRMSDRSLSLVQLAWRDRHRLLRG